MEGSQNQGRYGHHPDAEIDYEIEIERLTGLLAECHAGLLRALDFRAGTPEAINILNDVRHVLRSTGFVGLLGTRQ